MDNHDLGRHDLIVARSTAAGPGAIAIVRVDGRGTADLTRRMFRAHGLAHPVDTPRRAVLGQWVVESREAGAANQIVDTGLALFFQAPHSFTGNDLAEFHCHGGPAVVRRLVRLAVEEGARPARAGEFTRRAFLNGRMDLAQAEAVADLIVAETEAGARAAQSQLRGGLSQRIHALRDRLILLAAEIEARIDFPDEGIEPADLERLTGYFTLIRDGVVELLKAGGRGRLLREGAKVVLIGPPNVGKSSLLNALTRSDRAIVTPHPGTTRDTVEAMIDLGGIPVTLIDTAGLRLSDEPIEQIGIERTRRAIDEADIVVEVRDATGTIRPVPPSEGHARRPDLIVENKADLAPLKGDDKPLNAHLPRISAATGLGLQMLEAQLLELLVGGGSLTSEPYAINERHLSLLRQSLGHMDEARCGWDAQFGAELVMIDLRESLAALDAILGLGPHEAILDEVFNRFCIGK